jgi:hypothetical protein
VFGVFFSFHVFNIVRGALFTVFLAKKIAVTSNLERRSGDLRTRLKINWKPVCPHQDFVRKYIKFVCLIEIKIYGKKTPNTLQENNPLPPVPNVCVPEVHVYLTIQISQSLLSCRAIQKSLVYIA